MFSALLRPVRAGLPLLLAFLFAACMNDDPTDRIDRRVAELVTPHADSVQVAVSVRDSLTGVVYDHNGDRLFHAASTMKVPVMIEIFRQAEAGRFGLDDSIRVKRTFRSIVDSSAYQLPPSTDSDRALYDLVGRRATIRDLTERMINVSSNLATNLLIEFVSADSVQRTIRRLGAREMEVLRGVEDLPAFEAGLNNTATSADLALLLDALVRGEAVSPEADRAMIEILLGQRFDEMIPAGLPEDARVAHKTGQITAIHHDAAVVYPSDAPPYVLVILIEGFSDDADSSRLGAEITRAVHEVLRGPEE